MNKTMGIIGIKQDMKKILFYTSLVFLSGSIFVSAATIKPANNLGIVGWWPLNEGASTLAHDISGYENNGTLVNTPTWIDGKKGKGISMTSASSQYMNVANYSNLSPGSSDFTISFWTKTSATTNADIIDAVNGNADSFTSGFNVSISTGSLCSGSIQKIYFNMANGTSRDTGLCSSSAINDGQWHHVAIVIRRSQDKTMYIDGIQNAQNSTSLTGSVTLPILRFAGTPAFWGYYTGSLDDIRIYHRSLDATEVSALYRSGEVTKKTVSQNGLIAWWKFDEGTSTKVNDFSGNSNTGTFVGSPSWVTGKFGSAISTNNTSGDYINAPNVDIGADWTATAWFKYPLSSIGPTWNTLFRGDTASGDHQVIVQKSTNLLGMYDNNGTNFRSTGFNMTTLSSGWHHITVVGTGTVQNFYIDSAYVGQTDKKSTTNIRSIGNYWGSNQNWGTFDDVRIYDRALSTSEISSLYKETALNINHSQNTKLTDGLVGLWSFNGSDMNWTSSSAGTAYDRSGGGNDGTLTNMNQSTSPVAGKVGQAINFDGTNDYVVTSGNILTGASEVTFSYWLNIDTQPSSFRRMLYDSASGVNIYFTGNGSNGLYGTVGNGISGWIMQSPDLRGRWNHIVVTANASDGKTRSYLNGTAVSVQNSSFSTMTLDALNFGRDPGGSYYLQGAMDEVRVYNRQLSATEIKQLYLMGK
ncbi:MAG: hypothetical protein COV01_02545 [Candidatus Taylorbacteria bacterium CG10_big_fil_rev_8_21_14_0_10_41_48]|uniref:Laminin G domain-containing protein n=1 Tax=Candidatus Taylorbacteria bacterium CG10_big_fil_rev_8_21_14_0_10_41_48 TaxID=1975024 RepID=A0A2M8LCL7_9BACT|nr:MAG: hypothetical protein COV01_02545 [Candidatus Taylorbacteria bacterium CG10_big_fil_rev_8_21_14_0_10_41_48]